MWFTSFTEIEKRRKKVHLFYSLRCILFFRIKDKTNKAVFVKQNATKTKHDLTV